MATDLESTLNREYHIRFKVDDQILPPTDGELAIALTVYAAPGVSVLGLPNSGFLSFNYERNYRPDKGAGRRSESCLETVYISRGGSVISPTFEADKSLSIQFLPFNKVIYSTKRLNQCFRHPVAMAIVYVP